MHQDQTLPPIMSYFCLHYPPKTLSKARLTKLVYLADWYSALVDGRQLTDIDWVFNHYGPYVEDVVKLAENDSNFEIEEMRTLYGTLKNVIRCKQPQQYPIRDQHVKDILDYVVKNTKSLFFNQFIELVYSTYPVQTQSRYTHLDLVTLAKEANELAQQTEHKTTVMPQTPCYS